MVGEADLSLPRDTTLPGNGLESSADTIVVKLDKNETHTLLRKIPRTDQVTVEEMLLSALGKTFHNWTGSSFIRIDKEGHGREEIIGETDLTRTLGWFTSLFPINLIIPSGSSGRQLVQAVKQQVRSIPHRGFSFGPLSYLNNSPRIKNDLKTISNAEILFNYLGNLSQLTNHSPLFHATSPIELFRAPDEQRCYLLEINSFIINDQLEIHWTFSKDRHTTDTIAKISSNYILFLQDLIGEFADLPEAVLPSSVPQIKAADASQVQTNDVDGLYPLTPLQSGILFHTLKDPDSGIYIEQYCCTFDGKFNIKLFQQAWNSLVHHHPVLRTAFTWDNSDHPIQAVHDGVTLEWYEEDLDGKSEDQISAYLDDYLDRDRVKGFSLTDPPLMRCALFNLGQETHRWIWSFHHIICDGWSTALILHELFDHYDSLCKNLPTRQSTHRPFQDYVLWIEQQNLFEAEGFWKKQLKGLSSPTRLPIRLSNDSHHGFGRQELTFSKELTESLTVVARKKRLTLNTIIVGAWSILLHRYSGEKDIIFGTTVSGRPPSLEGVETMIGLFINTLPLRTTIQAERPISEWMADLLVKQIELRDYEYSSLVNVHEWSDFQPGVPLFESIVVFENYPTQRTASDNQREYQIKDIEYIEQSNYPISIIALPEDRFRLISVYNKRYFSNDSIDRLLHHVQTIIQAFAENPDQIIDSLPLITKEEFKLLEKWQGKTKPPQTGPPVHRMFENQAFSSPYKDAVVCKTERSSYQEINSRANRLAHYLLENASSPGALHGIYIDRSVEMVVAIMAVLKSGAGYVPLDPTYPAKRIAYMISDAKPETILTVNRLLSKLPESNSSAICIDDESIGTDHFSDSNPDSFEDFESIAYVIYTSGTTGYPKGVMISHGNLRNSTMERIQYYKKRAERFLLLSSISFDSSVAGIFGTLCQGGSLYIPEQEKYRDVSYISDLIDKNSISHILAIPSLYQHLLQFYGTKIRSLKTVIVAGEPCPHNLVEKHLSLLPHTQLFNEYGPTEATVWSTVFDCSTRYASNSVPIGRPIGNLQVYLLDKCLRQVPPGIPGELHLAGASLSPGYLNQPDLTAERFISVSFNHREQRVYKTGDLVRFNDDGALEFLGRNDDQIKLRGYRIELGEIETALKSSSPIHQAAVLPKKSSRHQIKTSEIAEEAPTDSISGFTAFIELQQGKKIEIDEIKSSLARILPDYMIPADFIVMDSLPLSPNGKINRRLLPDPTRIEGEQESAVFEPKTPLQIKIAKIWCEVLDLKTVDMNNNFFDLGGHSLLAVTLFAQIKRETRLDLPLAMLFTSPTLADLTENISREVHQRHAEKSTPLSLWRKIVYPKSASPEAMPHSTQSLWDVIVPIKKEGTLTPLFFLHAIGGNVLNYSALIPYLDKRQPVYGLQAKGLDGISKPFQNLHEMLAHYVQQIQAVQAQGPYLLAGASMGGNLALEVAHLLQEKGEEVIFLGMFDTKGPEDYFQTEQQSVNKENNNLPHPGILSRIVDQWPNNRASSLLAHAANLSMYFICKIMRKPRPDDLRQWVMVYSNLKLMRNYHPKPYNGKITLFRSSYSRNEEHYYGWKNIAIKGIDIIEIPAHHGNFVESAELGKELNSYLSDLRSTNKL